MKRQLVSVQYRFGHSRKIKIALKNHQENEYTIGLFEAKKVGNDDDFGIWVPNVPIIVNENEDIEITPVSMRKKSKILFVDIEENNTKII